MRQWRILAAAILMTAVPATAWAARGYATSTVHMRAGPGTEYPVVDTIPDNARVNIHGCLDARDWCDVGFSGDRGWVSARYLNYFYNDRYVYLPDYFDRIDVPIVTFVLGSYWHDHYAGRAFYRRRAHFGNVYRAHRGHHQRAHIGRPHRAHGVVAPHRRQPAIGHRTHTRGIGQHHRIGAGHRAIGAGAMRRHQGGGVRHMGGAHRGGGRPHIGGGGGHGGGGHRGGGGGHGGGGHGGGHGGGGHHGHH